MLVADRAWTDLFERTIALGADPRAAANWITQDLAGLLKERGISIAQAEEEDRISPKDLADLIEGVREIGNTQAKQLLADRLETVRGQRFLHRRKSRALE